MTSLLPTGPLRIGTRGSPLALAQARETRERLMSAHPGLAVPGAIEIVVIKTTGDRILDRTLAEAGGKGLFTKEIEEALAAGTIDLAVHSMKDVPTLLPDGLDISCLLPRADPRDAWFSGTGQSLDELPAGAVVGTASLRRQAQVLARRPDLRVVPLRGNVGTRLAKLAAAEVAATLLAMAGLIRLGLTDRVSGVLEPEIMLPAVAQGAIGIETRRADTATRALLHPLHCSGTEARVSAERALLAVLDGSCRTPIAAHARLDGHGGLALSAVVLRPDGRESFSWACSGPASEAALLGAEAGHQLKARLPSDILGVR
jgi:hydroxymethylbilane synthase